VPIFICCGAPLRNLRQNMLQQLQRSRRCAPAHAGGAFSSFDRVRESGYDLARMSFAIVLAPEAVEDLRRLTANVRATVRSALETHLRHEPEKTSRSRIKQLRGLRRPQYRLRVGEIRVFYDISGTTVEVLAIVAKSEAESWLARFGDPE
jgi:mRNA interferase RelE/StbE